MLQEHSVGNTKPLQLAGAVLLCLAIMLGFYTGKYAFLLVPFGILFGGLVIANWKTAWWLFLFSIPLSMQVAVLGDSLATSLPDEPIMWLFLVMFVVMLAARPNIMPEWFYRNRLTLIIVLQYIWTIVAVCFSQEHFISIKFLIAKSWFLVAYFVLPILIFRKKADFKRAFLLFLIPLLVAMVIIFIRHAAFGFAFLKINKAVGKIFYNRVDYSTVMAMFFPLLLVALQLSRNLRLWWKVLLFGIILFFLAAIYLTFARGAMMAVVFALVMGFAIRIKMGKFVMPAFYIVVLSTVLYFATDKRYISLRPDYNQTYTHLTFSDHLVATFRGQDMSSMERLYRWIASLRMSEKHPLVGVGPNAFYEYYKPHAVTTFRTYVSRNTERSTTHNYFLFMLVEQGYPAMILYGLLIAAFFVQAQKVYHRFEDRYYKKVTIGVAMMFASGFINNFFSEMLETHKVGALFYLSIALMIVLDRKSRQEKEVIEQGEVLK